MICRACGDRGLVVVEFVYGTVETPCFDCPAGRGLVEAAES